MVRFLILIVLAESSRILQDCHGSDQFSFGRILQSFSFKRHMTITQSEQSPQGKGTRQWKLKSWLGMAFLLFFQGGCTTALSERWPPPHDAPLQELYVSLDTWHAMIGFPRKNERVVPGHHPPTGDVASEADVSYFEEWGFAERAWYLGGQQGFSGILRALLWPTEGVVEIGQYAELWATRTPQPPADLFLFRVSEQGLRRVQQYLAETLAAKTPIYVAGKSRFYVAKDSYHLFHHCHFYIAMALHAAGLPISPSFSISRSSLAWQLEQVVERTKDKTIAIKVQE